MNGDENFCYYEHPFSRCGATTEAKRLACKFYMPGHVGGCAHFCGGFDCRCDNAFANFEAYSSMIKEKQKEGF